MDRISVFLFSTCLCYCVCVCVCVCVCKRARTRTCLVAYACTCMRIHICVRMLARMSGNGVLSAADKCHDTQRHTSCACTTSVSYSQLENFHDKRVVATQKKMMPAGMLGMVSFSKYFRGQRTVIFFAKAVCAPYTWLMATLTILHTTLPLHCFDLACAVFSILFGLAQFQ
jgi:hypothetical protein